MQTTWTFQVDKRADVHGLFAIKVNLTTDIHDYQQKKGTLWHIDGISITHHHSHNNIGIERLRFAVPKHTHTQTISCHPWNWIKNLSEFVSPLHSSSLLFCLWNAQVFGATWYLTMRYVMRCVQVFVSCYRCLWVFKCARERKHALASVFFLRCWYFSSSLVN